MGGDDQLIIDNLTIAGQVVRDWNAPREGDQLIANVNGLQTQEGATITPIIRPAGWPVATTITTNTLARKLGLE